MALSLSVYVCVPEKLEGEKLNVAEVTQSEIAQKQKLQTVLERINDSLKLSTRSIRWNVDCKTSDYTKGWFMVSSSKFWHSYAVVVCSSKSAYSSVLMGTLGGSFFIDSVFTIKTGVIVFTFSETALSDISSGVQTRCFVIFLTMNLETFGRVYNLGWGVVQSTRNTGEEIQISKAGQSQLLLCKPAQFCRGAHQLRQHSLQAALALWMPVLQLWQRFDTPPQICFSLVLVVHAYNCAMHAYPIMLIYTFFLAHSDWNYGWHRFSTFFFLV